MKTSARAAFALSLMFSAVLFACLAVAANVKQRPQKSSTARAKAAAARRARDKRAAKPAPRAATPEQVRLSTPPPVVRRRTPAAYDSPREAAEFFRLKRLPEGATELPVEKYFEAQEQMRLMPQYSTAEDRMLPARAAMRKQDLESLPAWTELGPNNIGGRTRALLIHPANPSVMYAAGVSGGVWKTTNGGALWTPLADLMANLAVNSLAMDPKNPNVIYAGTGEGYFNIDGIRGAGVFKTTDGGATWTRLASTTTEDFYYVNDIVVSPTSSQRLYAATGVGVFRSLDGGASWTRILNPTKPSSATTVTGGCLDLAIRTDKASDYLFASCGTIIDQATVYRNTNAATSSAWSPVLSESGMGRTSLAIAPSDQSVIYAAAASITENNYLDGLHAVFRSTGSGDPGSWTSQVRNADVSLLNTLLFSNTWAAFQTQCGFGSNSVIASQGWYDNVIAVDPTNPNTVFVGGIDLFRSDDGGRNWGLASYWWANGRIAPLAPQYAHADQHAITFHPQYNGTSNQTMFIANDGGIFRTDNARAATGAGYTAACIPASSAVIWTPLNDGYATTQFYHGTVYPDGATYFGGTQDNGTLRGTDSIGANGWKEILGGDGGPVAVDFVNPNILYASNPGRNIQKSIDGGVTFFPAIDGIDDRYRLFINPFVMDPSDSQRLWTGGAYLWSSRNGAVSWERGIYTPGSGIVSAIAVAPTDANRVLVGMTAGEVVRTNLGLTSINSNDWPYAYLRGGYVSWVAFDPTNANIAYATYSTFGGTHVWRSIDGGVNWTGIDGTGANKIPDVPVHCIVIDPSNPTRLYVGTDLGVFVSTDSGQTWAVENTGFANVATEALALNTVNGVNTLYAFTHGRGVWRVNPGTSGCRTTLSATSRTFDASGITSSVTVTANPDSCAWTAKSNVDWITINSGASGSGSGAVGFTVALNNTTAERTGTATIAGQTFTVTQRRCNCAISPDKHSFPAGGGTSSATVSASAGTLWQAISGANWITINSGSSGNGNGAVSFTVAANTENNTRFGSLTIAGQTLTVGQFGSAGSCAMSPIALGATANGELTASDCYSTIRAYSGSEYYADRYSFSGVSGQPIAITLTTAGLSPFVSLIGADGMVIAESGSGSNSLRVPPANGFFSLSSTGAYVIEVTALHSGGTGSYALNLSTVPTGCSYSISPGNQSFSDNGGSGNINVTTGSGCNWQAVSSATWFTLNSSSGSGTGNGTIGFSVATNYTPEPRTGTINVSGKVFTVTQAARNCPPKLISFGQTVTGYRGESGDCRNDYSFGYIYYDRYSFTGSAGQSVFIVHTESSTSYTGLYGPDGAYISQNSGGSYTLPSDGTYLIQLTGYNGAGDYTLSLLSATAGCKYSLSSNGLAIGAGGGTRSVNLLTSNGCAWQAASHASWVTINNTSGSGSGAVSITISPNTSASGRSGYLYIAGQYLQVSQSGDLSKCAVTPIKAGQTITGKIDYGDCYLGSGYYADRYSFEATAGQIASILSSPLQASLIGPDGRYIASGQVTIFSAILPLTGTYIIQVSYDPPPFFDYTLRLGIASAGCDYRFSSNGTFFTSSGGLGSVNLLTSGNCMWNAISSENWLTINSATSGSGSGIVSFSVAPSDPASFRSGQIVIGGQVFTVTQTTPTCPKMITSGQTINGATGSCGMVSFNGTAGQAVSLSVVGKNFRPKFYLLDPNGLKLIDQPNLRNNYSIQAPSIGLPVSGLYTLVVYHDFFVTADYSVSMENAGTAGCTYSATINGQSFGASGGNGSVSVGAETGCYWQAQSDAAWITFSAASDGNSNGIVPFKVTPNTGPGPRSGKLTVAGKSFDVNQLGNASNCTLTPISLGQRVSGSWNDGDCPSSAGDYKYADRYSFTGTAGQAIGISQNPGANYTAVYLIGPDGAVLGGDSFYYYLYIPAGGGYFSLPANGTYIIEVASGSPRSYDLSLNNGGACAPALSSTSQTFDSSGGLRSVSLTTGCSWRAMSDVPWITISSDGGKGNSTISYTVAPNFGAASRTGTINIAGQTLTITQTGRSCASATPISHGQNAIGALSANDCASLVIADLNYRADRYTFTGAAGQLVALSLNSAAFDPYLYLIGPDGAVLAEDDDGGDALNARIPAGSGFFRLPANGAYTVEVTSFEPMSAGDYTLRLSVTTCNYAVAPLQPPRYEAAGGSGSVTVSCADGCEWTAASQASWITLTAGASGAGSGSVAFNVAPNTSALGRSGTISVAGQTVTITQTAAVASVSAASFGGAELASESIVAAFGAGLATATQAATSLPLPTTLAGTRVKVRDSAGVERDAPLFFVAPAQVNYLIPAGTAAGAATVTITSGDGKVSTGVVQIAAVAPGLFSANASGQGVASGVALRVKADGTQTFEPIARFDQAQNRFVAAPIDLGSATDQVFLILYGTGFRNRSALAAVACKIGGADAEVLFAGASPGFAGLDQSNVRLPRSLAGRGEVDVVMMVDGKAANTVRIAVK